MTENQRGFDTYDVVVEKIEELTPRNKGLRFAIQGSKTLRFQSGQYMQMFIPREGEKPRRTPYSIASSPQQNNSFDLCVTLVEGGQSSGFIHHLKEGDALHAFGPLGKFTLPQTINSDLVFIATGSGIAPFRSMILDLLNRGVQKNIYLIFGNRYEEGIIYRKEWEALAEKYKNFHPLFTLSRGEWDGPRGYVQDKIEGTVPGLPEKNFYICGLNAMIVAVSERLQSLGVPKEKIHYERYD